MDCDHQQPEPSFRLLNRFVVAASLVTLSFAVGCQTDPRARREIALLRAEVVALEDRYYALKSRCGNDGLEACDDGLQNGGIQIDDGMSNMDPSSDVAPSSNSIQYEPPANPATTQPRIQQPQQEELKLELEEGVPGDQPPETKKDGQSSARARRGTPVKTAAAPRRSQKDLKFRVVGNDTDGDQVDDSMQIQIDLDPNQPPQDVHVSMMDPQLPNGQQRTGNWRFGREAIRRLDSASLTNTTLTLTSPWDRRPQNPSRHPDA